MEKWATWKPQLPQRLYVLRLCITVRWEVDKSHCCLNDDEMCSRASLNVQRLSLGPVCCTLCTVLLFYTCLQQVTHINFNLVNVYCPQISAVFHFAANINIKYKSSLYVCVLQYRYITCVCIKCICP